MRKIRLIAVGLIMILLLAACGNSQEDKGFSEPSTSRGEQESTEGTYSPTESQQEETTSTEGVTEPTEEATTEPAETKPETKPETESESETEENIFAGDVDPEYADLKWSEDFVFTSNGDGTCTLTEIGNCEDKLIVIPAVSPQGDKVTKIGERAFYYADDAEEIIFAGVSMELEKSALASCDIEKLVISGCNLIVGENAFSYCDKIEDIYISNSQIDLDEYAFYDVGDDAALAIKNTTGIIGDNAFQSTSFASIVIADCELEINENAFAYNEDIESLTLFGGVLEIGEYAFYDCGKKMEVGISEMEITVGDNAFQSSEIITLTVEDCDLIIGDSAFAYCEDLSEITIEANEIEIGEYAFYDCTDLSKVSIKLNEEGEIIIEDNAFQSCDALVEAVIEGAVAEIGSSAFAYCQKLERVQFDCDQIDVGQSAFYVCADGLLITYKGVNYTAKSIEDAK